MGWSSRVRPALPKPITPSGQVCTKPNSTLCTQPQTSSTPSISYLLLLKGYAPERRRAGKGLIGLGRSTRGSRAPSSRGEKQTDPPPPPLLKRKLSTRKMYTVFTRQTMHREHSHSRASGGSRPKILHAVTPNVILRETSPFCKLRCQQGTKIISDVYLYPGHESRESLRVTFFTLVLYTQRFEVTVRSHTLILTNIIKGQLCSPGSPRMGWTDG